MRHLRHLSKYFWKYRVRLSIGILFIVVSNYFGVLTPQVTGFIIDYVQRMLDMPGYVPRNNASSYDILVQKLIAYVNSVSFSIPQVVAIAGVTILALALLKGFFMFLMRQTIIVMSRHIEFDQKNEVYSHFQRLDPAFYKRNNTGDMMSRMAEDVSRVRMFTGPAVMYLVNLITLISLTIFFMVKRSPMLTLYVLAPLPILALIIYFVNTIIQKKSEGLQATLASLTTNAQQAYSGIRVIKSFAQERNMLKFFDANSEKYRKEAVTLAKIEALYFPSMSLFIGLSTLLTIMIGGLQYINGSSEVGLDTIVEFVIYINMLTFPVSAIGWTASMIQRAASSQKRLNELLHTNPDIVNDTEATAIPLTGQIEFRDVTFIYPDTGIRALNNFNLSIREGEKVAIVGRTGSGKSTIVQLMLRMYDVSSGSILFNGTDSRKIDITHLRSQISYVPQDGFLFSDTIENNILFGYQKGSKEQVREAAKMAAIHSDIEHFPSGYQTMVGERGITLSGGQKQRVSIARALIKETPIIILDDSLSAVDNRTEKQILDHIRSYMENRTSILITHKLGALQMFDRIVVLSNGTVAESGKHADLMQKKGLYFEMFNRQQKQSGDAVL